MQSRTLCCLSPQIFQEEWKCGGWRGEEIFHPACMLLVKNGSSFWGDGHREGEGGTDREAVVLVGGRVT